ncbi:MATE family efflux transporter [Halorussus limi]|uniref:Multidrug-efflux transporter n=2 Tax=Halorussus limi TaxID=2938695 RepID=A0A8U0HXC1_9EURY|nr:MATE family efflux transporter [Halorussus limi]UPV75775.1 MATE family efflux transporter [Halorussus limi]
MAESVRARVLAVWRRVLSLSWPIMAEQTLRTLMRTTDIVVTGLFSPAAVAAIGLADLFARLPLRIGLGLGSGAIALSSQDTGASKTRRVSDDEGVGDAESDATANRNEAITQAIVIGILAGVPFVLFGLFAGEAAIAALGAPPDVAEMGGTYLAVIFVTAPARHVALIAARSLQGTGDTRTPMYVNVVSNLFNILGTVALGLGVGPVPRLEILGVGIATAFGNLLTAVALLAAIRGPWAAASFARPTDPTIAKQLLEVSAPRIAEGLAATVAEFPFNAILLAFGTEVNAAYQIGRRMHQQVTSPLSRGYHVAASVIVGQSLGEGHPDRARFEGWASSALGLVTVGTIGILLFFGAEWFVRLFTDDPATLEYAADFARVYGLVSPFLVLYVVLSGALQGGSDTRTPFVARTTGMFGFMVGFSWLFGVYLGFGVEGVYAGIFLYFVWALLVVAAGFRWGGWAGKAAAMMEERGSVEEAS